MHRAGLGDRVERGVHDRVADDAADDVVLAPVDLAPLHAARLHLRVDVAGERVEGLVVVVVGVERGVREGRSPPQLTRPTGCVHSARARCARSALVVDLDWSVVEAGRKQMQESGACELPGFVRPDALAGVRRRRARAWRRSRTAAAASAPCISASPTRSFPLDHPHQWLGNYGVGAVAYDLFPADSPIRQLFEWDELRAFVAAILGLDDDLSRTPIRSARSTSR